MIFYDIDIDTYKEYSFDDRGEIPGEFDSALGNVVGSFSFLEESLCNLISIFLDIGNEKADLITSELSFKNRVNLLANLFKYKYEKGDLNVDGEDSQLRVKELVRLCFRAEEERNKIIHSSYVAEKFRIKKTAKAKGYKQTIERTNAAKILNVSEFIGAIGMSVEELPLALNIATSISGKYNTVKYYSGDKVIAEFGYDFQNET